jgi:hypothetical protein
MWKFKKYTLIAKKLSVLVVFVMNYLGMAMKFENIWMLLFVVLFCTRNNQRIDMEFIILSIEFISHVLVIL